jgi:hypothetical protein
VTETRRVAVRHPSAFAPLANRAFLGLWIANLLSNIGGWMQSTGAAWEMTSLSSEPIYVALLVGGRHAADVPVLLPGRHPGRPLRARRYIIVCQFWMMGVAGALAVLAFIGPAHGLEPADPDFLMGVGNAMNGPAWHAVVPEIVSGPQLGPRSRLNSAGFNLARTIGPGDRPDAARAGRRLPAVCHQHRHLHRRDRGDGRLEAAGRRPAPPAPRGLARGGPRRNAFVRASGELKAIFARGLCFFVPGIA